MWFVFAFVFACNCRCVQDLSRRAPSWLSETAAVMRTCQTGPQSSVVNNRRKSAESMVCLWVSAGLVHKSLSFCAGEKKGVSRNGAAEENGGGLYRHQLWLDLFTPYSKNSASVQLRLPFYTSGGKTAVAADNKPTFATSASSQNWNLSCLHRTSVGWAVALWWQVFVDVHLTIKHETGG